MIKFTIASTKGGVGKTTLTANLGALLADIHLQIAGLNGDTILCEEIIPLACTGQADAPQWLTPEDGERLLGSRPDRNLIQTAVDQQLVLLLPALPIFQQTLALVAAQRANAQLSTHARVREAARTKGRVTVQPVLPVDILGAYVLLPTPSASGAAHP